MNDLVKKELFRIVDINKLINRYKSSNKTSLFRNDKNLINIMPFTDVYTNMNCKGQNLDIAFSRTAHIANLIFMQSCSIYIGTCRRCKCIYGPSSILDQHTNQIIITHQLIQSVDYVYFSGDLVYLRQLLTIFSNSFIHAHTTFEDFAESYISTLSDLHPYQVPMYSPNTFAKHLEIVWLYYELSRFIFITTCETSVSFPKSFQPETRSIFIEKNLPVLFRIFTVFWSNHHIINGIKCKEELCSWVMLIDGRQKCTRIICQFDNVTNMSHPEMGPVVQGCPYAPRRTKKDEKRKDQLGFYCSHHAKYIEKMKNGEQSYTNEYKEANKIDQQIIADLDNEDMCNTNDFGVGHRFFAQKIEPHFISPCIFESVYFDLNEKCEITKEKECKVEPLERNYEEHERDDEEMIE
ncbi:unnamed protein product [Rotaria sordida]|uniref:Uncharacterized protein n=1 Tax=Rotaria sordida TaxID=392033 RepID=A0A814Q8D3_9BILA|nr:unnamed protein product [Rotaria sordida]CAF3750679.1 unnamed protein product [Rotaria sordida]